jgi:hypothetical protein
MKRKLKKNPPSKSTIRDKGGKGFSREMLTIPFPVTA